METIEISPEQFVTAWTLTPSIEMLPQVIRIAFGVETTVKQLSRQAKMYRSKGVRLKVF